MQISGLRASLKVLRFRVDDDGEAERRVLGLTLAFPLNPPTARQFDTAVAKHLYVENTPCAEIADCAFSLVERGTLHCVTLADHHEPTVSPWVTLTEVSLAKLKVRRVSGESYFKATLEMECDVPDPQVVYRLIERFSGSLWIDISDRQGDLPLDREDGADSDETITLGGAGLPTVTTTGKKLHQAARRIARGV